ncbi:hypothetical protein SCUP515_13366, partial [Seiridium cupressi]
MIQAGTAVGASPSGPLKDENDHQALADLQRHEDSDDEDEEEDEKATLSGWVALLTLFVSTILVAFCAEFMVEGISSIT